MLTIFSTPKPFKGHINTIQRNAIKSWTLLHPGVEVILFGDDKGAAEVCEELAIRHEPVAERDEHGLKFLNYLFARAQKIAKHEVLCYLNCDILLMADFQLAVRRVSERWNRFLMVGRRWDVDIDSPIDFRETGWEQPVRHLVSSSGLQRSCYYIDYFAFRKGLYQEIPPLVIGRVCWDNWLVWSARSKDAAVIDASRFVTAVHQNHDYSYHPSGEYGVWNDEVALRNRRLAGGGRRLHTIDDAAYRLEPQGFRYNWLRWYLLWRRTVPVAYYAAWFAFLRITRALRHKFGLRQGFMARAGQRASRN